MRCLLLRSSRDLLAPRRNRQSRPFRAVAGWPRPELGAASLVLAVSLPTLWRASAHTAPATLPRTDTMGIPRQLALILHSARAPTIAEFIPQPIEALGLSSDQEQQVRAISSRWRPKAAQAVVPLRTAVADLENGVFAEMMCVMTPDQRAKCLEELRGFHAHSVLIARRFRFVDAKQCPTTAVTH
jgi:hypothetical protein